MFIKQFSVATTIFYLKLEIAMNKQVYKFFILLHGHRFAYRGIHCLRWGGAFGVDDTQYIQDVLFFSVMLKQGPKHTVRYCTLLNHVQNKPNTFNF
jgi:hypothetical protein